MLEDIANDDSQMINARIEMLYDADGSAQKPIIHRVKVLARKSKKNI